MRRSPDLLALSLFWSLVWTFGTMAVLGSRREMANTVRAKSGARPLQASATPWPTSVLPDLRFYDDGSSWPGWRYDRSCFNGPYHLIIKVENGGGTAAGPFLVQDKEMEWLVRGLGPGEALDIYAGDHYPVFPLVIDPYDEVMESAEDNNVITLPLKTPWTPTWVFVAVQETPAALRNPAGNKLPARVLTQPLPCPTRTPEPSLTPSDKPDRPDLVVSDSSWQARPIVRQGLNCLPPGQVFRFSLSILNQGTADSGGFVVGMERTRWEIQGLAAGASRTLDPDLRFLPNSVVVDMDNAVEESREDNNTWLPPRAGTPTPPLTPPPLCMPTPTPTPVPTERLPDLRLEWLRWRVVVFDRLLCLGPIWRLDLAIRNDGRSPAGSFVVSTRDFRWSFDGGILAESVRVFPDGPWNSVGWPILIDALDQVHESNEDNNRVDPDLTLTATPNATQPPICSVTATLTPTSTLTPTRRPSATATRTRRPRPTPSRTVSPLVTVRTLALPMVGRP